MNFDNMNNQSGFERALEIIRRDSQNRPVYGCCQPTNNGGGTVGPTGPIGPTGATGATGATDTLISESK